MHNIQSKIIKALEKRSRTYSELYKPLAIRSNRFDYHLKQVLEKELVAKKDQRYYLTNKGESFAPYLDIEHQPIIAVVLRIKYNNKIVLVKRKKEAFNGYWAMPGGKIQKDELIEDAISRILKKETGLQIINHKYVATIQETVLEDDSEKHHFILLLYDIEAEGELMDAQAYSELPEKTVPSDLEMFNLSERFATSVIRCHNGKLHQEVFSAH